MKKEILLFMLFCWSLRGYSEHVAMQWNWEDISESPQNADDRSEINKQWKESCQSLAGLLRPGKGPYGWGIFTSHSCFLMDNHTSGKKNIPTQWLLEFLQVSGGLRVSLYHQDEASDLPKRSENKKPISTVFIEGLDDVISILGSDKFAPLLLANLWDQAPFVRKLVKRKRKYQRFSGPPAPLVDPFPLPPAPERMTLYKMIDYGTSDRGWVGEPVVTAISDSSDVIYLHSGANTDGPVWVLEKPMKIEKELWMHHSNGAFSMSEDLQKRLKDAVDLIQDIGLLGAVAEAFSMSVTSGYFGFRYGASMINQDYFEKNMSIMSLLFEIRAGPLQGIKFYADSWPSFSLPTGVEFGGSRQVLGWSFGLDVGPIYLDLTPTFGRWSVHMVLPAESIIEEVAVQDGVETVEIVTTTKLLPFSLQNSLSAGLELGAELQFQQHLYRFGYSRAYALPQGGQTANVQTSRYALDSFHKVPFFEEVESSLLIFFLLEFATFSDSAATVETENRIEDVTFAFVFSGLGVTFSW